MAFFSRDARRSAVARRHRAAGGRAYVVRGDTLPECDGEVETAIVTIDRVQVTVGGLARHNVANVLAAIGGARALGASIAEVRHGLIVPPLVSTGGGGGEDRG